MNSELLSYIVRQIDTPVKPGPAEYVVTLDAKTHEPVAKERWFVRPERYLVSSAPDLDSQPHLARSVQVPLQPDTHNATGRTFDVTVGYRAACLNTGHATLLAQWCARERGNFEAKLDALVRKWTNAAIEKVAKGEFPASSPIGWLTSELNAAATAECGALAFRFEPKLPAVVDNQVVGEKPLKAVIRLQNYDRPVEISIRLRLRCENPFRFFKAGSPNLEDWVTKEVVKLVEDEMWGTNYGTFLRKFEENRGKIRKTLEQRGREVLGYSITNLLTDPVTPEFELLEKLLITLELDCPTRREGQNVVMRLRFDGRLRDLESNVVRKLMATPPDGERNIIRVALERELSDQIKTYLRGVSLDDLLQSIHFDGLQKAQQLVRPIPWDAMDNHTALLRSRLEKVLDEFHAVATPNSSGPSLTVELLGDPVERAFEFFKSAPFALREISVLNQKTGRRVSLHLTITAESVVPGQIGAFLSRGHSHVSNRGALEIAFRDHLSGVLQSFPERGLKFQSAAEQEVVRTVLTAKLNEFTQTTYGITTKVVTVKREASEIDVKNAVELETLESAERLRERKTLLGAQTDLRVKQIEAANDEADRWMTERPYSGAPARSPQEIGAQLDALVDQAADPDDEAEWKRMLEAAQKPPPALPENPAPPPAP